LKLDINAKVTVIVYSADWNIQLSWAQMDLVVRVGDVVVEIDRFCDAQNCRRSVQEPRLPRIHPPQQPSADAKVVRPAVGRVLLWNRVRLCAKDPRMGGDRRLVLCVRIPVKEH